MALFSVAKNNNRWQKQAFFMCTTDSMQGPPAPETRVKAKPVSSHCHGNSYWLWESRDSAVRVSLAVCLAPWTLWFYRNARGWWVLLCLWHPLWFFRKHGVDEEQSAHTSWLGSWFWKEICESCENEGSAEQNCQWCRLLSNHIFLCMLSK